MEVTSKHSSKLLRHSKTVRECLTMITHHLHLGPDHSYEFQVDASCVQAESTRYPSLGGAKQSLLRAPSSHFTAQM